MSNNKLSVPLWIDLYNNRLKNSNGGFTGKVKSGGSMRNKEVARVFVNGRTEYRYETILNILDITDDIKLEALASGKVVTDGLGMHYLTTRGVYTGENAQYDTSVNSLKVAFIPSKELKASLNAAEVSTNGTKTVGPVINSLTDSTTGDINGELTSGGPAIIEGRNIKVAGEDETNGFYLTPDEDNATPIKVTMIVENNPSKVIIILPTLESSKQYWLDIITQYSNGSSLLKAPRSYRFPVILGTPTPSEPEEDEPVVQSIAP